MVLGGPGSGKTVLAVHFILDRLAHRASGDPVPVLFSLSSWQPDRERLRDWMAAQLHATYPGAPWTRELLKAGLVLPVLDGLDELPKPSWGTALQRLNAELTEGQRVVVTCRKEAYTQAVETGDVFTAAAVMELQPVAFESASAYLMRTARPVRGVSGRRATRWDPVLAHLRTQPDTPASHTLRHVLSSPLMVAMARAVYGDTGKDPADLLNDRFADPAAVEEHLLEAFVPASFTDSPNAGRARDWLGYLAAAMQRHSTGRLAWWRLRLELPWLLRRLGPILLMGCASVALSTVWVLARGMFNSAAYVPPSGAYLPVVTGAFVGGVCLGYLALSRSRQEAAAGTGEGRQVPRDVVRIAAAAVPVGVAVGWTTSIRWRTSVAYLPYGEPSLGWLGPVTLAVACGLATATTLAVLGITGKPLPLYTPLARRRFITSAVIAPLSAAYVYLFALLALASYWASAVAAVLAGGLVALGVRTRQNDAARTLRPYNVERRVRGRLRRSLLRGLTAGLLAGLCLGSAFGVAAATTLSIRAVQRAAFPNGTVHRLADGTRYVVTPNGWLHGLRPNGDRYLRTPRPVDGVVLERSDNRRVAGTAAQWDRATPLPCSGRCTRFNGPIEIHMRHPGVDPQVRLPDGTYAEDRGFSRELPKRSFDWLFVASPGALFASTMTLSLTIGLGLGLISGLASGVHTWLVTPADTARAVSPRTSLRTDRTTAITRGVTLASIGVLPTVTLPALPPFLLGPEQEYASVYTLAWLFVGPLAICLSAWFWFLITRLWLCSTQRLPWRLMAFLEEAHRRGVLRQAGATYEFRHTQLQEHLAPSINRSGNGQVPDTPPV
ncbi:NACHT domain-containing protein [Streptomyces sp. NPDC005209]|uniref:NACHT domain-containing protein n=1 Tax=Streptomyces sp. NPDC005209 TaxID=3156715 RepID=UPI0033BAC236